MKKKINGLSLSFEKLRQLGSRHTICHQIIQLVTCMNLCSFLNLKLINQDYKFKTRGKSQVRKDKFCFVFNMGHTCSSHIQDLRRLITCIIFAGLTFRRVQLSLYTWTYFNPGTFRLRPFSARSRSSANSFSIVFQPNRWLFRVKSLAPCGLELYRAAIMFFSHKMFRRKQK